MIITSRLSVGYLSPAHYNPWKGLTVTDTMTARENLDALFERQNFLAHKLGEEHNSLPKDSPRRVELKAANMLLTTSAENWQIADKALRSGGDSETPRLEVVRLLNSVEDTLNAKDKIKVVPVLRSETVKVPRKTALDDTAVDLPVVVVPADPRVKKGKTSSTDESKVLTLSDEHIAVLRKFTPAELHDALKGGNLMSTEDRVLLNVLHTLLPGVAQIKGLKVAIQIGMWLKGKQKPSKDD
jgi:hypothetical protein